MNFQHKGLANGNWKKLTFTAHMANIGSEIERTILWKEKGNKEYSFKAFERALELLYLTIAFNNKKSRLKELTRLREILIDYFVFDNQYHSSSQLWRKYFFPFYYAVQRNK